ncbi:Hint domain-containing protein [Acidocella sp. KAb 2-4]|uniref:Hint domain-containing protein n=1 Tax=Acidocella sp. KAb 2-4 TaxID=2885158 RepID=UPI001D06EC75|nr:Hint domain-containing protein [Acidocella sp. KAb 2-4]MCB5945308.1 Hint domain-containing protein [Acidocella sp. KAb 2-4]
MATYSIASGGTLTITQPSTVGTNIEFLNNAGDSGVLIFTNGAMGVNTATVNGTLSTSAYFGGTVQNFQPGAYGVGGDQVTLQVIKSLFSALDVAATAATDNVSFANIATLASQGGEAILLVDGTVTPAAGAPLTLDANQQTIIEEMAVGLFGTAVASATLMLSFADVRPDPNSNHPYVDGVFTALAPVNPCFAAGTRILTPRGEVAVEELAVGDLVITRAGEEQPVVWIGRREIDLTAQLRPEAVRPVIIEAGALGEGMPARDLRLSPDHALYLDGMLVPAKALVNWANIRQDHAARRVTYYHLELPRHDVIFAEAAAVESFLDTGHRGVFDNADEPVIALPEAMQARREAESCGSLCTGGPALEAIRQRIAGRQVGVRLSL